jgi:two-component system NtrC family sensor kinase
MPFKVKLLLVEDNPGDVRLIQEMLLESGATRFNLHVIDRLAAALEYIRENSVDLILLDLSLPDSQGLESLHKILVSAPDVAVVVLSGLDDETTALEAVHSGAQDYLIKGQVDYQLLFRALRYALERKRNDLTLRKAVVEAETERAKTEAVVASVGVGICIVDLDYRITYQNQRSRELEGNRIGETCYKYCAGEKNVCKICPVAKTFIDKQTHQLQRRHVRNGQISYLDIVASPLHDPDGKLIGGIKVVVDVTEKRLAAEALERLSIQNQLLLNSAGEGILGLDLEGKHTFVNPAAANMLGYEIEEMVGKFSHLMWHHTRADGSPYPLEDCPVYAVFKDGQIRHHEDEVFWRKDGTSFPVEYITTPIHEKGKISGAVVTFMDISERKQAQETLRESEERYRDLFENANDLIQSVDNEGRFLYVNKSWLQTLGYSEEEVANLSIFDIISPDDWEHCEKLFAEVMGGKNIERIEAKFRTKDGQDIYVEGSVNSKIVDGKSVSSRAIFRDITDRIKNAQEKQKMQEQLIQAQKMEAVGTLAGGVAHDFNNFLTTIQGYSEMAMRATDKQSQLYKDLEAIQTSCQRAAGIIRQLLLFSRKQVMELKPISINMAVENLIKMLRRLLGENILIVPDLAKDVSPVLGDYGNIEQIVMNLCVNARDAMPEGGKVSIKTENVVIDEEYCQRVTNAKPGKFVCLSVADDGEGLDLKTIDHIFEPFFTTKDVGKGTGLGLSVVYGIMEEHKGWIEVASEAGTGTEFKAYFPAISGKCAVERHGLYPFEDIQGQGERILLVEDEHDLREFAATALDKNGYKVFAAASGKEAYELFDKEKGNFDLVFSDVVLPDTNGVKVVETLLEKKPELKVLLSSGYTDDKAQCSIIEKQKYRFLEKPYSLPRLLFVLRELLKKQKMDAL